MKVANASLSQIPSHHFMVTRSPNHMWAISWATTSATRSSSARAAAGRVDQQRGLAEGDAAQVLHGPEGEVGDGHEVELVGRVGDVEVVGEEAQRVRGDLEGEARSGGPCPGTWTTRTGTPSTSTGSVASSGPDDRRPPGTSTSSSSGRSAPRRRPAGVERPPRPPASSSRPPARGSTTRVISKTALRSGSSQHGKARRASVDSIWVVAMVWVAPSSSVNVLR